jgi:hypothetical protein
VWLAQAHREVPDVMPAGWRERWAEESATHGQSPLPDSFLDETRLQVPEPDGVAARNLRTAEQALARTLELLGSR